MLPVTKDAVTGPTLVHALAEIYVVAGEYDKAIDQLEFALAVPDDISASLIRLDPLYEPLREHPRFQALLKRYQQESNSSG